MDGNTPDVIRKEIEQISFVISCGEESVGRGERLSHKAICDISFHNIDKEVKEEAIKAVDEFQEKLKKIIAEEVADG